MFNNVTATALALAIGASLLASASPSAEAPLRTSSWTVKDLGVLPGADFSLGQHINERGQVAGVSGIQGFVWQSGRMAAIGRLGQHMVDGVMAFNNRGQAFAYGYNETGLRAFLWEHGSLRDLGTLGGSYSLPSAHPGSLNDRGEAVGESATVGELNHAVLWRRESIVDLGTLPGDVYSGQRYQQPGSGGGLELGRRGNPRVHLAPRRDDRARITRRKGQLSNSHQRSGSGHRLEHAPLRRGARILVGTRARSRAELARRSPQLPAGQ